MTGEVRIRAGILEEMMRLARLQPEMECCGVLAGTGGIITHIFPTRNALASPVAYEIPPLDLFELFRRFREQGLQHLGQYHSHLTSDNFPSATDIAQAYYATEAYFIVTLRANELRPVRAFTISEGRAAELEIVAD